MARFVTNEVVTNRGGTVPFSFTWILIDVIVCVCVSEREREWVLVCMCACCSCWGGGGGCLRARCVSTCTRARGCVLKIYQNEMETADSEISSTQRFQTLSLLRDDVHGGFYEPDNYSRARRQSP